MNLTGRSFLKEIDFTKDEFVGLIDLGCLSPRGKANSHASSWLWRAEYRPDLREDLDPDPLGLRSGRT